MRRHPPICSLAPIVLAILSLSLTAQNAPRELPNSPVNLSFQDDQIGSMPKGWGGSGKNKGYSEEVRHDGCKKGGNCAVVIGSPQSDSFGTMSQGIDATPYRGKIIRLRAWLKAEPAGPGDRAQMWLRVDRAANQFGLFDNMDDRPVTTPQWVQAEISGAVSEDATAIYFGVMSIGHGKAWVDGMAFDVVRGTTDGKPNKALQRSASGGSPAPAQNFPSAMSKSPVNLSFQDDAIGSVPKGWGGTGKSYGYSEEVRHDGCKNGANCAVVIGSPQTSNEFGTLTQCIDATAYQGKIIRLRAWLKAEPAGSGDRAQMWLRVDRAANQMGLFDNMDNRPVTTPQWVQAEIGGAVSKDATGMCFGVMSLGHGKAWVDGMTFDVVRDATDAELAKVQQTGGGGPAPQKLGKWDVIIPVGVVLVFILLLRLPWTRPHVSNALLPQLGEDAPHWNLATRLLFLLFFANLLLRALPDPLWNGINVWSAVHVFHLSGDAIVVKITGSGDKALNWVEAFNMLAISLSITLIWSILDRRRVNYAALNAWMRLLVRYSMAGTLFGYGFAKIFPLQMPAPNFRRLMEPWGDFSPMGIAWTFIGTSVAYELFAGASEVLAGVLLLFRRTAMAGSLATLAVMLHIFVLNMCFDIPVKLYSFSLMLAAAYIAAPDFGRMFHFFFLNRTAPPSTAHPPAFENRWMRYASLALKVGVIGWLLSQTLAPSYQSYEQRIANVVRPPLYGLYEVVRFVRDGQLVAPGADPTRWKKFMWEKEKMVDVIAVSDARSSFAADCDTAKHTITLSLPGGAKDVLTYTQNSEGLLHLQGTLAGHNVDIQMVNSRLLATGFHWIAERPVNR